MSRRESARARRGRSKENSRRRFVWVGWLVAAIVLVAIASLLGRHTFVASQPVMQKPVPQVISESSGPIKGSGFKDVEAVKDPVADETRWLATSYRQWLDAHPDSGVTNEAVTAYIALNNQYVTRCAKHGVTVPKLHAGPDWQYVKQMGAVRDHLLSKGWACEFQPVLITNDRQGKPRKLVWMYFGKLKSRKEGVLTSNGKSTPYVLDIVQEYVETEQVPFAGITVGQHVSIFFDRIERLADEAIVSAQLPEAPPQTSVGFYDWLQWHSSYAPDNPGAFRALVLADLIHQTATHELQHVRDKGANELMNDPRTTLAGQVKIRALLEARAVLRAMKEGEAPVFDVGVVATWQTDKDSVYKEAAGIILNALHGEKGLSIAFSEQYRANDWEGLRGLALIGLEQLDLFYEETLKHRGALDPLKMAGEILGKQRKSN